MKKSKLLSVIVVLAMVISLVPAVLVGASAADDTAAATKYKVTVTAAEENEVKVSAAEAAEFDKVEITWNTLPGSLLTQIKVTGKDGRRLTVYGDDKGYSFSMPASDVKVEVFFAPFGTPQLMKFTDVADDAAYYEAVYYCFRMGYMNGTSETTFAPDMKLTRAMACTVLYRLDSEKKAESDAKFTDVDYESWYGKAVDWASAAGITAGVGDGKFNPGGELTHEQWITMLYRYADYAKYDLSVGEDTNILSYKDFTEVDEWAISAFSWACGQGIIDGTDGLLKPLDVSTRAFLAETIMNCQQSYGIYN